MTSSTMIVVADPEAGDDAKDEIVRVIRAAVLREFPDLNFRFFSSEDRDLVLRNMTSH